MVSRCPVALCCVAGAATTTEWPADAATLAPWADAGATWWLESLWVAPAGADHGESVRRRVRLGPPAP